ncbi:enoyl-CoA-hydratase DpgB [Actinomadura rugatobispora]|uniref:Enoyl-CoA-hydratase DpgB n=1 Tax=Actinomadura rugatobispora TaxID=1994 RepID=A0ABW1ADR7_9ACTN|nr:hypothetical protein GCM10010200_021540 [Actinomadura rugatobispora]
MNTDPVVMAEQTGKGGADMFEAGTPAGIDEGLTVRVDGAAAFSAGTVRALGAVCDRAEDHAGPGVVVVQVTGAPEGAWTGALDTPLVTKWERVLRRLERLPMTTVAVAAGDVGGPALDALLATDLRIAGPDVRLLVAGDGVATWPGMAVFRLVQQAGAAAIRSALLFGVPVEASRALGLGLLTEVADDPAAALTAAAGRFGGFSGSELAIRRRLMFDAATMSFEDALGAHLAACDRALRQLAEAGTAS